MSSMKPMALAAREPSGPAEMVLTRTPHLRPASYASTRVSLSSAAFALLMPPPYPAGGVRAVKLARRDPDGCSGAWTQRRQATCTHKHTLLSQQTGASWPYPDSKALLGRQAAPARDSPTGCPGRTGHDALRCEVGERHGGAAAVHERPKALQHGHVRVRGSAQRRQVALWAPQQHRPLSRLSSAWSKL